ncbi:MAG: PIN domain-containing protein [Verrucomicrobiota bacterium]|nr:PIN domain-containing protein [Verrucomicrobiota bacterium]
MIIADTSVWIDFLRNDSAQFRSALNRREIATHTVIIGELAAGNLRNRQQTLTMLRSLHRSHEGQVDECMHYLELHRLHGRGLNWNDIQLLVAAHLTHAPIWSLDQKLAEAAGKFKLRYLAR